MMTKTKLTIRVGFHRLQCLKNVSKKSFNHRGFFQREKRTNNWTFSEHNS